MIKTPNRFVRTSAHDGALAKARIEFRFSLTHGSGGLVPAPQLNAFNDKPNARFTISGHCPPKIPIGLVTSFRKSRYDTLDRDDRFFACRIGIENGAALNHIIVRIKPKFDDLVAMIGRLPAQC